MRAEFPAAIDRRLASLIGRRASRKSLILRLVPPWLLEPIVAPRVRRLRTQLIVCGLGVSLLLAVAVLYLAVGT